MKNILETYKLPLLPNIISYTQKAKPTSGNGKWGTTIPIEYLTDKELELIAEEWKNELLKRARANRVKSDGGES